MGGGGFKFLEIPARHCGEHLRVGGPICTMERRGVEIGGASQEGWQSVWQSSNPEVRD